VEAGSLKRAVPLIVSKKTTKLHYGTMQQFTAKKDTTSPAVDIIG
jgi:hypothetical protein